jgi:hypothetical protein
VTAAGATAHLETFDGGERGERLEAARCGVQVGHELRAGDCFLGAGSTSLCVTSLDRVSSDFPLACVVKLHHAPACEVEGVCCCKKGEKTDLDHGVVHDLVLTNLPGRCITVLELLANRAVAGCNGHTAGEDATSLHDNVGADPGQGAVDEGG